VFHLMLLLKCSIWCYCWSVPLSVSVDVFHLM
jgi:hypothetical protein